MRRVLAAGAAVGLCALAACQDPPGPDEADQLSARISARLGRRVELHYVETEPDGVHATCGWAGDPPRRAMRATTPPPPGDVIFIWAQGQLALQPERPDFDDLFRRNCPSMPRLLATPIS